MPQKNKPLTKKQEEMMAREQKIYRKMQASPIYFIEKVWHLIPQPPLPQYKEEVQSYINSYQLDKILPEHYIDKDIRPETNTHQLFEKGKHITWQQYIILLAFEKAIKRIAPRKISVSSGNGIGKSCTASWIVIWFLYCFPKCQVPCTSPSESQMFDVLWKEISLWLSRAPDIIRDKLEWQSKYIRIHDYKGSEEVWFARARTARKENPEALSGVHADHVLLMIDEASAVPDEIFAHARGALTNQNAFVFLISNPTRLLGYFKRSQHENKEAFQCFTFSSLESPVVDPNFLNEFDNKTEEDDEFRIFGLGLFPKEDQVDDEGYSPLLKESDRREIPPKGNPMTKEYWITKPKLGIDPAGQGSDKAMFVVRDAFKAAIVKEVSNSNEHILSAIALQIMATLDIDEDDVFVDQFGIGAKTVVKLAKLNKDIQGIDVGDRCEDDEEHAKYLNMRARNYYGRLKPWIISGGELIENSVWKKEWSSNRYARSTEQNSKIKMMSKKRMKKLHIPSPNGMDALMLTFQEDDEDAITAKESQANKRDNEYYDPISRTKKVRSGTYFPGRQNEPSNLNSPI